MPIVNCPECGHDVSTAAVACPGCGKPLGISTAPARPVVARVDKQEQGIPPWAFVAFGVIAVLVLFFIFAMMGREDELETANTNIRVGVEGDRAESSGTDRVDTDLPSYDSTMPDPPTSVPGSQTSVAQPEKGVVRIDAKVVSASGDPRPVGNEKFYLLENDLERILSDAGLRPIEGNSLANSLGLAVMYPDRYGDFHSQALDAINENIEYSGMTDSAGKAELSNVDPGRYYLFAITKTADGFAIWSSPVAVNAGENNLNLAPQRLNEIRASAG